MKVGLDTHRHEAGECYTRKIADHWEDGRNCGDPRCEEASTLKTVTLEEWQEAVRNGYAGLDLNKTTWMLYLDDNGATVWGQVRIVGPVVNGEQFAPGYTYEAAEHEQRTR